MSSVNTINYFYMGQDRVRRMDKNGNGTIEYAEEFLPTLKQNNTDVLESEIQQLFSLIDRNRDGSITALEYGATAQASMDLDIRNPLEYLKYVKERPEERLAKLNTILGDLKTAQNNLYKSEAGQALSRMDRNEDETLSQEEFPTSARNLFTVLDVNRDNKLTLNEMAANSKVIAEQFAGDAHAARSEALDNAPKFTARLRTAQAELNGGQAGTNPFGSLNSMFMMLVLLGKFRKN